MLLGTPRASSSELSELSGIGSYVQSLADRHEFSGNVLIALHDRIMFERAYGEADVALHVPNTLATRFRIFSVTKQFVAAAIMVLEQQGKIDVQAPLSRYLVRVPAGWKGVTVAQVLNHSSGIPQLEDVWFQAFQDAPERQSQCQNYDAILGKIATSDVSTTPGTVWRYNNFGYDLLGCVIERTSGESLAAFMSASVFHPAGMTSSGLAGKLLNSELQYNGPRVVEHLASGYNGSLGTFGHLQEAMPLQYGSAAAGDMYSTVGDLWLYSEALYHASVLSSSTQQKMLDDNISVAGGLEGPSCAPKCAPLHRVTTRNLRWGLGWAIVNVRGHVVVSHSGGNNGFSAEFARYPDEHATIIVLSNFGFADVTAMRREMARQLFRGKYVP